MNSANKTNIIRSTANKSHDSSGLRLEFNLLDPSVRLSRPVSDLSLSFGMASNDEGDLEMAIYAMGGCVAQYRPIITHIGHIAKDPQRAQEYEYQYHCPEVSNTNEAYNPLTQTFEHRTPVPHPRHHHTSTAAIDGLIWIFGGRDAHDRIVTQIDVFDPIRNTWITLDAGLEHITIPVPALNDNDNDNNDDDDDDDDGITATLTVPYTVSHHI